MAVKADGTLIIETGVDLDGFQNDCKRLQQSARNAARSILDIEKNLESVMDRLASSSSEAGSEADTAEKRAKSARKEAKGAAKEAGKAAKKAEKVREEINGIKDKEIIISRMEDVPQDDYDGPLRLPEEIDTRNMGYSKEAMEFIGAEAKEAETHINSLRIEISRTESALKEMEEAGKFFGDTDYDEAYTELRMLNQEVKEYQERLNLAASLNPFDLDTFAGKIREAEMELARLSEAGKGLGNEDFDQAYRKLVLLKEEAKAYAKELAKTPETKNLKEYEKAVTGAKKKTKSFSSVLNGTTKRLSRLADVVSRTTGTLIRGVGNGARVMAGFNRQTDNTRMTMGKMLATSLLFGAVFRVVSAVTGGMNEGLQNLSMYSDETNTSISMLMSSMTRLKNSFATAFAPILTVVSPILVSFINLISKALTYVGMFFAALSGKDSFVRAVGVQQDYRESLSGTADAANNLADATKEAKKENDKYLSGLDEIRRWETSSDNNGTSGSGGGGDISTPSAGSLLPEDMFETVPIESSIQGLADRIKKLLQNEDWEGLGKFVADELNKGMHRIYDVISWKKVGPKVTKFTRGFTTAFNSMAGDLDFELAGRIVGAGINDLVNTFNLLIGPGGIDFDLTGRKLSQGLRGSIREIGWSELGNLLGNYFMISWNIFGGFVADMAEKDDAGLTGWKELGQAIGKSVNGLADRIDLTHAGLTLASGINGMFESVLELTETIEWDDMAEDVSSGLNTAFTNLDWKDAGRSLNAFFGSLVGFLTGILEETDWNELGQGVGEFLSEIEWKRHLWQMVKAIASAIGDAFDGLEESGTAGKILAFLGKAFIAVKIADITGLDTLVKKLVGKIGDSLISGENITSVSGKLKHLFGSGTKEAGDLLEDLGKTAGGAGGGFGTLAGKLAPLIGEVGLIAGVTFGVIELTKGIAGLIEKIQGGNGQLSSMGGAINDLSGKLQNMGAVSGAQADEIRKIIDSCEDSKMSAEEMAETVMAKFAEWGLSTEKVNAVLQDNNYWTSQAKGNVDLLTQSAEQLGAGMSKTAGEISLSEVTVKEALGGMRDSMWELSMSGSEFSGTYQGILMSMDDTLASSATAQEAFDLLAGQLEAAGVPTDELIAKMSEKFPQAVQAVKTSVDTNVTGARQTIDREMKTAEKAVDSTTSNMKTDAESNLSGVQSAAEEAFSNVDATTVTKWGSSAAEVKKNLDQMKQAAAVKLGEMTKTVTSYSESMYNIMTKKWGYMAMRIGQLITEMNSDEVKPGLGNTVDIMNSMWRQAENRTAQTWSRIGRIVSDAVSGMGENIRRQMNSVISTVNYGVSNINYSISGIEVAMNFGPWEVPTATGSRTIGFHASFPRVSRVPYLASGAVIPPRSEFLAVLGDQKQGNNIEAPEGLLRKIVREETGSTGAGGRYQFTAQINRRTIFDQVIEEGKLRRDQNGDNPFLLE